MRSSLLTLFRSVLSFAVADPDLDDNNICLNACEETLDALIFNGTDTPSDNYFVAECTNVLRVQSMYICAKLYCKPSEIAPGYDYWNYFCQTYGNVTLLPYYIIANITDDEIEHIRVITLEDINSTVPIAELVVPTKELFDISPSTLVDWTFEYNIRGLYRWAMYWFWFGVVTMGPTGRLLSYTVFHITSRPQPDTENNATYRFNTKPTWIERCQFWTKRYLTLLPTPGYTPPESTSWYTVPPLLQSLTVAAFVVMNIILCAVNYRAFNGNFYTKSSIQVWRYLADRTGIMAVANVPIIWLFAMRNNFLLWVTGWHFRTFNNFHRWTARVATVQALLHSIGYTVIYLQDYGRAEYESDFRVNWFYFGVIATIPMVLACSIAFTPLRRRFYEIFLYGHIALSIVCLVTLWVHVDYMGSDYNNLIWASAAIWSFDRLLRLGRMAILNFKFWNARATASYSSDADVIRLQVPLSSDLLKPVAGAYYYFYVFNGIRFWENHPFTLASFVGTTPPIQQQSTPSPKDVLECKTTELDIAPVSPSISSSQNSSELMPTTPSLLFTTRPQNGFTRSLRNTITRSNEKNAAESTKMRVLVEGPYGSRPPLHLFDHILFVVCGSGITVALSHISMGLTFAKPTQQST